MKYKNIELLNGQDSEAELLCSVEFENPNESEEIIENMEDNIMNLLRGFENDIYTETVMDTLIQVRSNKITFDNQGVALLKKIYETLTNAQMDAKITVSVHVDGDDWFKRADGSEYNEDECSFEEFIQNMEY